LRRKSYARQSNRGGAAFIEKKWRVALLKNWVSAAYESVHALGFTRRNLFNYEAAERRGKKYKILLPFSQLPLREISYLLLARCKA
jgi:hypothetical protein